MRRPPYLRAGRWGQGRRLQGSPGLLPRPGSQVQGATRSYEAHLVRRPVSDETGPVGPPPAQAGGPELLIGDYSATPIRRVGRWADGFISGGVPDPEQVRQMFDLAQESWSTEGREGRPRLVATLYYVLRPRPQRSSRRRLHTPLLQLLRTSCRRHGKIYPL